MNKLKFYFISCLLLFVSAIKVDGKEVDPERTITVADYCSFLNRVASSDAENLYEEKMGERALILREGVPGCYHYEVVEEHSMLSMTYLTLVGANRYRNWREVGDDLVKIFPTSDSDPLLQSNDTIFQKSRKSEYKKESGGNDNSWKETLEGAALAGIFLAGGEEREPQRPLVLEDFRRVLSQSNAPEKTELILTGEPGQEVIAIRSSSSSGNNDQQRRGIMKKLREIVSFPNMRPHLQDRDPSIRRLRIEPVQKNDFFGL